MSNQKIGKLLTNIINEDAIEFKNSLSKILYEKVNSKLRNEYVRISQNLFENATMSTGVVGSPDSRSIGDFSQTQQTSFANQTLNMQPTVSAAVPMFSPSSAPLGSDPNKDNEWNNFTEQQRREMLQEYLRWWNSLTEEERKAWDRSKDGKKWYRRINNLP